MFSPITLLVSATLVLGQHGSPAPATHGTAQAKSPNSALSMLMEGNTRFYTGEKLRPRQSSERRIETAQNGQKPFASILSCADSRVPIELIFDVGIGDLFVVRVAGNVADPAEVGSLEYGVGHLGTPVLVVMGHSKCGAVTAVVTNAKVGGSIPSFTDNIEPAVEKTRSQNVGASQDALVEKSIKANIWQSVEDIIKSSEEIRTLIRKNELKMVGAVYDLESGKVTNLGVHPRQEQLLKAYGSELLKKPGKKTTAEAEDL